jgi:hypothetical protein
MKEATGLHLVALKETVKDRKKMAHAGGRKVSELGTHKCEMNAGEGNGKPLLNNAPCLGNSLQNHQESNQTWTTTTTTTTTTKDRKMRKKT